MIKELSKSVLRRLPGYLDYLKAMPEDAPVNISATSLAAALGMAAEGLPSTDGYAVYMTGMYLREAVAVWKLWLMGI